MIWVESKKMTRSAWAITLSVWRALFLREAMHRLFYRRGAWVWLMLEPVLQMVFLAFLFYCHTCQSYWRH
jgi:capsular polysaccharide transport system permease protein